MIYQALINAGFAATAEPSSNTAMEEWQASFVQKSEKRRRRSSRRRLIRQVKLIVFISLTIMAGLWLFDQFADGPGGAEGYGSVGHIRHR
jgi:fatty acid desaturase